MGTRAAVIGAGHHGLVAAIRLAAHGCDVDVLEATERPGGAVRSEQLTLPGFVHDACSGFFPLTAASPAFRELGLELEWANPPLAMVHVLDQDGGQIALHRDLGSTAQSLEACARGAGAGWQRLVETLWPHRQALIRAVLARLPPLRAAAELLVRLRLGRDRPGASDAGLLCRRRPGAVWRLSGHRVARRLGRTCRSLPARLRQRRIRARAEFLGPRGRMALSARRRRPAHRGARGTAT